MLTASYNCKEAVRIGLSSFRVPLEIIERNSLRNIRGELWVDRSVWVRKVPGDVSRVRICLGSIASGHRAQ